MVVSQALPPPEQPSRFDPKAKAKEAEAKKKEELLKKQAAKTAAKPAAAKAVIKPLNKAKPL